MPEGDRINGGPTEHDSLMGRPPPQNTREWKDLPGHVVYISWQVLISNYVNVLLVFIPAGIVTGAMGINPTVVFILNFFAIIPLASLLSFATEELSIKLGQTLGGLLNASFGNAVELIVSFPAEASPPSAQR